MRIIIVDDDGIVREGLAKNIPWAEHGVEVVGTAKDGREGWLLVEQLLPDVVLTDLRMPLLDGIGLAEKILAEKPGTKVVVLTGYDEFAYARKAVGAKVVDYILKWQDNAEILAAVLKAGAEAEAEEARERDARRSRLLLREDRWRGWLNGGAVAGADAELPLAVLSLACGPAGAAPRPAALRDLAYLLAERRGLRCAAAEFPESVAVCLESPASRENVASFAEELARGQARRWGEGCAPLVAFDEGPLAPRDAPTAWNRLEDLSKAARLAGRGGAVARDLMREWDNSPAALARKMKSLVDRDFARDSLSLVDAASEANLVPTYASTLFKKAQGIGFLEYLTSVRVDAARRLLAETDLPIGEIAFRVGLPNQRYFSSVFRKTAGVTPAAFRAEAQLLK